MESDLVDGKEMDADGSYLPVNVYAGSWTEVEVEAEQSMQSYLDLWTRNYLNSLDFTVRRHVL